MHLALLTPYLLAYSQVAHTWEAEFGEAWEKNQDYCQRFAQLDHLAAADWQAFQGLGEQLPAFEKHPMVRLRALQYPQHSLSQYRNQFIYLLHGQSPVEERIAHFISQIKGFHLTSTTELLSFVQPETYVAYTHEHLLALELLEVEIPKQAHVGKRYAHFLAAIQPLQAEFKKLVATDAALPMAFRFALFLKYVYQQRESIHSHDLQEGGSAAWEPWPQFWQCILGEATLGLEESLHKQCIAGKEAAMQALKRARKGDVILLADQEQIHALGVLRASFEGKEAEGACQAQVKWLEQRPLPWEQESVREEPGLYEFREWEALKSQYLALYPESSLQIEQLEAGISSVQELAEAPAPYYYPASQQEEVLQVKEAQAPYLTAEADAPFYGLDDLAEDSFLSKERLAEILEVWKRKQNLILAGPPGVGKSFLSSRLGYVLAGKKQASLQQKIQLHPNYSYEDLVQGYRPTEDGNFTLHEGSFVQFCQRAQTDPQRPYLFVMEEMNRASLSKVLGELLQLIEPDKRGADFALPLQYSGDLGERFFVPKNLYLIGTMNTADRSLSRIDYALQRRFAVVPLYPQFGEKFQAHLRAQKIPHELVAEIAEKMQALNQRISEETYALGPEYQIGHSYFTQVPEPPTEPRLWYEQIIHYEIAPLLKRYFAEEATRAQQEIQFLLDA